MGTYYSCEGCGNQEVGDTIYQCRKCTRIYCSSCGTWDKTKCPSCGDQTILFAPTIGRIESQSSNDSSSDSDDDDGPAPTLSEILDRIRADKDTMSSERKAKLNKFLLSWDWSEYPGAEECYNELNS